MRQTGNPSFTVMNNSTLQKKKQALRDNLKKRKIAVGELDRNNSSGMQARIRPLKAKPAGKTAEPAEKGDS